MTYRGHVRNGQVRLDEEAELPEGAEVKVQVIEAGEGKPVKRDAKNGEPQKFRPIKMPGGSLSDDLVRDRR